MSSRRRDRFTCRICVWVAAGILASHAHATVERSPEQETLRISKILKPIPDSMWTEIAGERISGKYEVTPGDNLSMISKRLFGDSRYWPKIWALNNNSIFNPHVIRPGSQIAFMPGTGTSLPSVSVESSDPTQETVLAEAPNATMNDAGGPISSRRKRRSQEWRRLPAQQWEAAQIENELAAKSELQIMGELSHVNRAIASRELPILAATQKLAPLGEIVSAPSANTYFRLGDQILIRGNGDLRATETYSIVGEPYLLEKDEKKRQGYSYRISGEVQIIGVHGDTWVGVVTQVRGFLPRGAVLIPRPARLQPMEPIPAPDSIEGTLYLDRETSTYITAQHAFAFVNLGSEDGLQEGMILQTYQVSDPNNGKAISGNLFHVSDMQVVQVSEQFSTVRIVSGITEIEDGTPVRLLTDVSRFQKYGAHPSGEASDQNLAPPVEEAPLEELPPQETTDVAPEPVAEPTPEELVAPEETPAPEADAAAQEVQDTNAEQVIPETAPEELPPAVEPPISEAPPAVAPETAPPAAPETPPAQTNPLDELDIQDDLGQEDKRELEQLERYKAQDPAATDPASLPPPPADDISQVVE